MCLEMWNSINRKEQAAVTMTRTISHQPKVGGRHRTEQRTNTPQQPSTILRKLLANTKPPSQRAFRERKERHVKDLELKLKSIEAHSTDLLGDNERLKRELDRLATQNEILRATTTPMRLPTQTTTTDPSQPQSFQQQLTPARTSASPDTTGPMIYSPSTFNAAFSDHQAPDEPISHRIQISATTGERLLSTGAAWELIQSHDLYRRGVVDIGEVSDRLKEKVFCDGSGPTFAEGEVIRAIEESVGAAGDELI